MMNVLPTSVSATAPPAGEATQAAQANDAGAVAPPGDAIRFSQMFNALRDDAYDDVGQLNDAWIADPEKDGLHDDMVSSAVAAPLALAMTMPAVAAPVVHDAMVAGDKDVDAGSSDGVPAVAAPKADAARFAVGDPISATRMPDAGISALSAITSMPAMPAPMAQPVKAVAANGIAEAVAKRAATDEQTFGAVNGSSAVNGRHTESANGARSNAEALSPFAAPSPDSTFSANATRGGTLALAGTPDQWRQPLREALGERLQVQIGTNSEHAVIRLDPPMLGRIDISIRHEAGSLRVQLSASSSEVLRQLHGIGDGLRQELIHRQYGDVAVVVSSTRHGDADSAGRQRQGNPQQEDELPHRALSEADQDASRLAFLKEHE